jgi:hypothetical protein
MSYLRALAIYANKDRNLYVDMLLAHDTGQSRIEFLTSPSSLVVIPPPYVEIRPKTYFRFTFLLLQLS